MRARLVLKQVYGKDVHSKRLTLTEDVGRLMNSFKDQISETKSSSKSKFTTANTERLLKVYPNPTNSNFNIFYNSESQEELIYVIHDLMGREIKKGILKPNKTYEIEGKVFGNGIYFITLIQGEKFAAREKIIIMK